MPVHQESSLLTEIIVYNFKKCKMFCRFFFHFDFVDYNLHIYIETQMLYILKSEMDVQKSGKVPTLYTSSVVLFFLMVTVTTCRSGNNTLRST